MYCDEVTCVSTVRGVDVYIVTIEENKLVVLGRCVGKQDLVQLGGGGVCEPTDQLPVFNISYLDSQYITCPCRTVSRVARIESFAVRRDAARHVGALQHYCLKKVLVPPHPLPNPSSLTSEEPCLGSREYSLSSHLAGDWGSILVRASSSSVLWCSAVYWWLSVKWSCRRCGSTLTPTITTLSRGNGREGKGR